MKQTHAYKLQECLCRVYSVYKNVERSVLYVTEGKEHRMGTAAVSVYSCLTIMHI